MDWCKVEEGIGIRGIGVAESEEEEWEEKEGEGKNSRVGGEQTLGKG